MTPMSRIQVRRKGNQNRNLYPLVSSNMAMENEPGLGTMFCQANDPKKTLRCPTTVHSHRSETNCNGVTEEHVFYINIYIYICIHTCTCIYIYIHVCIWDLLWLTWFACFQRGFHGSVEREVCQRNAAEQRQKPTAVLWLKSRQCSHPAKATRNETSIQLNRFNQV